MVRRKVPLYKKQPPTAADRRAFTEHFSIQPGRSGVSMKRDPDGVYLHTHRARSKSYPSVGRIPQSVYQFVKSTG